MDLSKVIFFLCLINGYFSKTGISTRFFFHNKSDFCIQMWKTVSIYQ